MILTFFDNNVNLFNRFLTNFISSIEFAICPGIPSREGPYHLESSPPIYNINASIWLEVFLGAILKQTPFLILILMLTSVLIVIWLAVSISVFDTCWNIYLLLRLWNLKVLAKWWHNLRQYLNAGFFTHYFFIYIFGKQAWLENYRFFLH